MSEPIIRVENLGKKYIISHQKEGRYRYKSLRDTITSGVKFLASKISNSAKKDILNPTREEYWALKDLSFEIKQGDRIGIIGRNGAGKSTLLKILSRITEPTKGKIAIKGRVASLLEVGTGFHPELTGRENIYLNGAILGMNRIEIKQKFDEIVAFAEVEKFLDTPVKRYSSGMYVRLAFAVAAHLEPEILIVDEVLAVGDVNFQKKCLNKMQNVSKQEGRTVLFVSHSREAIQRLCSQCILLEHGQLIEYDNTNTVMANYLSNNDHRTVPNEWFYLSETPRIGTGKSKFVAVKYSSYEKTVAFQAYPKGTLEFVVMIESDSLTQVGSLAVTLYNQSGIKLVNADTILIAQVINLRKGRNIVKLRIKQLYLNPGVYTVGFWLSHYLSGYWDEEQVLDFIESALEIEVVNCETNILGRRPQSDGVVHCDFEVSLVD